jgi:photosystem II stability/assembly factor-like uncharacterized protein
MELTMGNMIANVLGALIILVFVASVTLGGDYSTPGNINVNDLSILPYNSNILYAAVNNDGLYRSINGGKEWTRYAIEGMHDISTIHIDSKTHDIYIGTLYDIYISNDVDGARWSKLSGGMPWGAWRILIQQTTPPRMYIANSHGCHMLDMSKNNWKEIKIPVENIAITPVAIDPMDPMIIYVSMGRPEDVVLDDGWNGNGLYKSYDYGKNWEKIDSVGSSVLLIYPHDSNIMYSAFGKKILKSIDRGMSWEEKEIDGIKSNISSLTMNQNDSNVLYATTSEYYSYGVFGGTPVYSLSRIYKSVDGGETWHQASDFPANKVIIDPSDPDILYAGTPGWGIFKSTNAGKTWKSCNKGIKPRKLLKDR